MFTPVTVVMGATERFDPLKFGRLCNDAFAATSVLMLGLPPPSCRLQAASCIDMGGAEAHTQTHTDKVKRLLGLMYSVLPVKLVHITMTRTPVFPWQILPNSAAQYVKFCGTIIPKYLHSAAIWRCCSNGQHFKV